MSGTALESSLTGLLQVVLRPDVPYEVPVLETATQVLVHGFGDNLDEAMLAASRRTLDVLTGRYGLSRDDAYALMSMACDFTVTQVVDGRQGVHGSFSKSLFTAVQ